MSNNKKEKVIFLFPALNEEEGIGKTIREIPIKELEKLGYCCEIVAIDGQSTDRTVEIAKKEGATVLISPKRGYGYQYKHGLSKIKGDYVITGDADGTYPFNHAALLLEALKKENFDFITTNRFNHLEKGSMSFSHLLGNKILTLIANSLFGLKLKDSQCGMWCFKLDKIKELNLEDDDMAFSEEIKIKSFKKLKCKEVDINYKKREGTSKLNYGHAFKNMMFLFRQRLK